MRRSLIAAALASTLGAPVSATPLSITQIEPAGADHADQLGKLAVAFERVAADARQLVVDVRDRWRDWAAEHVPSPVPDLTVLTTEPVANTESSGFGWRDDPMRHDRRFHRGADFRADPGTPVLAAGDGTVVFAGRQGGYGNVIYVDHGGGVVTRYGHLRRIETRKDAVVTAGMRIGQVGSTGRATGPHLHFEIRLDDRAVDPVTAMTVATLERESPIAGRLASYTLIPEIQEHILNKEDQHSRRGESRPERPGRTKRSQVLW